MTTVLRGFSQEPGSAITTRPGGSSRYRSVAEAAAEGAADRSSGSFTVTVIGPIEPACARLQEALGLTSRSRLVTTLVAAADNLQQARRSADATTIRYLAQKVRNSAHATIKPALRQTVLDSVQRVMARACCQVRPPV